MSDMHNFAEYCTTRAAANRVAANQLEHAIDLRFVDRSVIDVELAHLAKLRRDADLWDQLAGEINDHLASEAQTTGAALW